MAVPREAEADRGLMMGASNEFACGSCGYRVEVSGGDDLGFSVRTTTILCEDCEHLYDVVTFRSRGGPGFGVKRLGAIEPECPKFNEHRIKRWRHPGTCPKCGNAMVLGEKVTIWD